MGKIKRRRSYEHRPQKRHSNINDATKKIQEQGGVSEQQPMSEAPPSFPNDIFQGMDIDLGSLPDLDAKRLATNWETQSVITSRSLRELGYSKRDKMKAKHDILTSKIETIGALRREERARKKRQSTPITGDLAPLQDALPTLELLLGKMDPSHKKGFNEPKKKAFKKEYTRMKEMNSNIALFQQVLKDPHFKKDPKSAIQEHLVNKQKIEDEQSQ